MRYVTLVEVEEFLNDFGIDDTALPFTLETIVDAMEAQIDNYCNTKFTATPFEEIVDGTGTEMLMVRHAPLISITSVAAIIGPQNFNYDASNLIVNSVGSITFRLPRYPIQVFHMGSNNIKVVGLYGYDPVPDDVKKILLEKVTVDVLRRVYVRQALKNDGRGVVQNRSIDGYSETFSAASVPTQAQIFQLITGTPQNSGGAVFRDIHEEILYKYRIIGVI